MADWKDRGEANRIQGMSAVCVILASGGYPGTYEKGKEIKGLDVLQGQEGVVVFHAGTDSSNGRTVTAGGRVLGVVAYGKSGIDAIRRKVYEMTSFLAFQGMHYRTDIGKISP
jgi:phosphoribosylamine--glycine ligase